MSFLLTSNIFAQKSNSPFELNTKTDSILLGSGIFLSGADLILDNCLKLNQVEYKGDIYEKDNINRLDRFFMNSYSKTKDSIANFTLLTTMITPIVLVSNEKSQWLTDFVMYTETLLIANGIKELTKLCVNRARPYMYYEPETYPKEDIESKDCFNSFPSGHTTMAFAAATFVSYTYCEYFPESSWKVPIICASYGLATTTATLRILSGNHFFTDVLVGAVIGSSTGFLVPYLHKINNSNETLDVNLSPTTVSFKFKF